MPSKTNPPITRVPYDDEPRPIGLRFVEVELNATLNVTVRNTVVMGIPASVEDDDLEEYLSENPNLMVTFDNGVPHAVKLTYAMDDLVHPSHSNVEVDVESIEMVSVDGVTPADSGNRVDLLFPAD